MTIIVNLSFTAFSQSRGGYGDRDGIQWLGYKSNNNDNDDNNKMVMKIVLFSFYNEHHSGTHQYSSLLKHVEVLIVKTLALNGYKNQ